MSRLAFRPEKMVWLPRLEDGAMASIFLSSYRWVRMVTSIARFKKRLAFLKAPALVVLILAGFMLEFIIELPLRIMALTAGTRS